MSNGMTSVCAELYERTEDMGIRSGALHRGKILSSINKIAVVQKTIIGTSHWGERSILPRPNGPVWPGLIPQGLATKFHSLLHFKR